MRASLTLGWLSFPALLTLAGPVRLDGPVVATLDAYPGKISCLAFSPDGKTLAAGGGFSFGKKTRGHVKMWDVATRQLRGTLGGHADAVQALAFAPDGRTLATAGLDGTVRIWDLRWHRERALLKGDKSVAFTPDGKTLAAGSWAPRTVKCWEVVTDKERVSLPVGSGRSPVAFLDHGKLLVTSDYHTMQVWDIVQRKRRLTFSAPDWDMSVAVSPDGKLLAAASQSVGARLWDLATGKLRFTWPPAAPDGC